VLVGPMGVTVDNNFNVYVTSFNASTVVVVKADGRHGKQLISSDDRLNRPTGIYFDKSKNSLLVTNWNGRAFIYEMC